MVGVVCSDESLLTRAAFGNYKLRDGSTSAIDIHLAEPGVFGLFGLEPVAGRFPVLLWQFTRPVLAATIIAWLVAGSVMSRWLEGFAHHVGLDPWLLLALRPRGWSSRWQR